MFEFKDHANGMYGEQLTVSVFEIATVQIEKIIFIFILVIFMFEVENEFLRIRYTILFI